MTSEMETFQLCQSFDDYEKLVNNIYRMYYEMLEKSINEYIHIYDKSIELDGYYKEINGKDVRYLIIEDYKACNTVDIKETRKGWKPQHSPKFLIKCNKNEFS